MGTTSVATLRLYQPASTHCGVKNHCDELRVRQPHAIGQVAQVAGLGVQAGKGVHLQKVRHAVADAEVEARLRQAGTVGDILDNASQELSRQSNHIGFAITSSPSTQLQHVDFVSLDARRVLVIVVSTGGHITHKVVDTTEEHDRGRLAEAATYINREFAGMTIEEARQAVASHLQEERVLYNALLSRALQLAQSGLNEVSPAQTVSIQGTSAFLNGLSDRDEKMTLETLRALFRMIEEKHRLLDLLTRYMSTNGLTIVIGSEHQEADMHPFSLVASTFQDGPRTATVGVIGPTRMRYPKTISVVDSLSQAVSRVL